MTEQIQIRELKEEELKKIIKQILSSPDKFEEEAKLILKLSLANRYVGCSYVYLYQSEAKIILGEVDKVILEEKWYDECSVGIEVAYIPKTIPVILTYKYHDDNPMVEDFIKIYVFTGDAWKSTTIYVPKP
jgi:hypothetical protein